MRGSLVFKTLGNHLQSRQRVRTLNHAPLGGGGGGLTRADSPTTACSSPCCCSPVALEAQAHDARLILALTQPSHDQGASRVVVRH